MAQIEIFVRGLLLDTDDKNENLGVAIDYAVADVRNITARKGNKTKTITVAGTKNNKAVFQFVDEINGVDTIDQRVKPSSRIDSDGVTLIEGSAMVIKIERDKDNNITQIKFVIVGENADWTTRLSLADLRDLDYSDENHVYSKANIDLSETIDDSRNYVYPLIDYGKFSGLGGDSVAVEDRLPAINVRNIMDKMWNNLGYRIQGKEIDSDRFKRLYMPTVGLRPKGLDPDFKKKNRFRLKRETAAFDFLGGNQGETPEIYVIPFAKLAAPTQGAHNNFLGESLTDEPGTPSNIGTNTVNTITAGSDMVCDLNLVYSYTNSFITVTQCSLKIQVNGITKASVIVTENAPGTRKGGNLRTGNILINAGDKLRAIVEWPAGAASNPAFGANIMSLKDSTTFLNIVDDSSVRGQLFNLSECLPDGSQLDLVKGIKHLKNLYFTTDTKARVIDIETRDDFYRKGTAKNWTDKIDFSKPITHSFIGSNMTKVIELGYKPDPNDRLVKQIEEKFEETIGAHEQTLANAWAKDIESKNQNPFFSVTIMAFVPRLGLGETQIPRMWNTDGFVRAEFSIEFAPRILYYDGIQPLTGDQQWDFEGEIRTTYPHFYSVDDIVVNDNSLFYGNTAKSTGLANNHFRNEFKTIDESRVLGLFLHLNDIDINTLDFRDPIELDVDGETAYYHLNIVEDYVPDPTDSVKAEFFKVVTDAPKTEVESDEDAAEDFDPIGDRETDDRNHGISSDSVTSGGSLSMGDGGSVTHTQTPKVSTYNMSKNMEPTADNQVLYGTNADVPEDALYAVGVGTLDNPQVALVYNNEGVLLAGGTTTIYTEIDGVNVPVLFQDSNNNLQEVKKTII